jgi:hypothetical protein
MWHLLESRAVEGLPFSEIPVYITRLAVRYYGKKLPDAKIFVKIIALSATYGQGCLRTHDRYGANRNTLHI